MVDTLINTTQDIDRGKLFVKDESEAINGASFFSLGPDARGNTDASLYRIMHNKYPPSLVSRAQVINHS